MIGKSIRCPSTVVERSRLVVSTSTGGFKAISSEVSRDYGRASSFLQYHAPRSDAGRRPSSPPPWLEVRRWSLDGQYSPQDSPTKKTPIIVNYGAS